MDPIKYLRNEINLRKLLLEDTFIIIYSSIKKKLNFVEKNLGF